MRYHFRVSPPADDVKLRILETGRKGPLLASTFHDRRRTLTHGDAVAIVLLAAARHLQDCLAIHWEPCGSGSKARAWYRERMPRVRKLPSIPAWRLTGVLTILDRYYLPPGGSLDRGKALWSGELRMWRQSVHAKLGRRAISRDESANAGADFSYPR
jgi:hypothetical protein